MSLSRKDYELIAEAFDQAYRDVHVGTYSEILGIDTALSHVADRLKNDNPRFDVARFRDAATQSRRKNL